MSYLRCLRLKLASPSPLTSLGKTYISPSVSFHFPSLAVPSQTPLCPSGVRESWNVPALQLWLNKSFTWMQKHTSCFVFMPVLICLIFYWLFFDCHCTLQQWFQRTAMMSLRALSRAATDCSKFIITCGWCRWGFPLDAVFFAICLHRSPSGKFLCFAGPFWSS